MNKISMKKGSEKREDSIYNKWFKEFNNEVKLSSNMTLCAFFSFEGGHKHMRSFLLIKMIKKDGTSIFFSFLFL